MNIDIARLRADRRELDRHIRTLEARLRTRWTQPMAAVQRELLAAKHHATQLCCLRAQLRGRQHLANAERSRELAEQVRRHYPLALDSAS